MSEEKFHKLSCGQCQGHLEFPAEAAGQTIDCPHCGKPLLLAAPKPAAAMPSVSDPKVKMKPAPAQWDEPVVEKDSKMPQVAVLVVLLVIIAGGGWFYQSWKNRPKTIKTVAKKTTSVVATPKSADPSKSLAPPKEEVEVPHNGPDLQVLKHQIERAKDKGSKLIYVTGTLTNHVKAQYFSVKVEFELFDKAGKSLGITFDQNANVAGRTKWDFKAMVLDDAVAKAEMVKIHGEKE